MKRLLLIILMFSGLMLFADKTIQLDPVVTGLELNSTSTDGFSVSLGITEVYSFEVATGEGSFSQIGIEGFSYTNTIGKPKLPILRKLITAPSNAEITINIISFSETEYKLSDYGVNNFLIPAQPSVSKDQDPDKLEFHYDPASYLRSGYNRNSIVRVEEAGSIRDSRLLTLIIQPIEYDPTAGKIRVINDISFEVEFSTSNLKEDMYVQQKNYSHYFDSMLKRTVLNYSSQNTRDTITRYPVKYVIISDPMFEDQLQPFIQWKKEKGFEVIDAYTDDPEVGNTTNSIKAYLQILYDSATPEDPAPTFLLLVGDIDQIPAWNGSTGGHVTDVKYVRLDGANNIPDMYFGRFSANNYTQLQPQIDKTIQYEKYLMPDPEYLEEVVMIAGVDANFAPIYGNGQINYGTDNYFNLEHGIISHTYLYPESGSSDGLIIQNVSDGVGYVNYTAHGYDQGWGDPSFTVNDINDLQNYYQYCMAVGNCCLTNKFDVPTCFGEAWLRAEDKGAIGYIGGTNNSFWNEDFWWGVGAGAISVDPAYNATGIGVYDGLFHENGEDFSDWHTTSGSMNFCGNMAVIEGGGSSNYYWEIYALMGDPSLETYLGIPQENNVTFQQVILLEQNMIEVTADPYTYVSLTKDGEIYGTVLIDDSGTADLEFDSFDTPGTALIVFTRQNRQPVIEEIEIVPNGAYVIVSSFEVNDDNNNIPEYNETISLNLDFTNVGNADIEEITGIHLH